jgi:hypothetical protein
MTLSLTASRQAFLLASNLAIVSKLIWLTHATISTDQFTCLQQRHGAAG